MAPGAKRGGAIAAAAARIAQSRGKMATKGKLPMPPNSKRPEPEDEILEALIKMLPRRSAPALQTVATWLTEECNVNYFSDLEGAEDVSQEVMSRLESATALSIGAKGIVKELFRVLPAFVDAEAEDEQPATLEEEEAADDDDGCEAAEDEDGCEAENQLVSAMAARPGQPKRSNAVAQYMSMAGRSSAFPGLAALAVSAAKRRKGPLMPFERVFLDQPEVLDDSQLVLMDAARAEMEVTVDGEAGKAFAPVTSFEEVQVFPAYALEALAEMGIEVPLPIQAQALPIILGGHDVTGIAKTGSGKTLAYLLPAIVHIEAQSHIPKGSVQPIALILAPTRELVVQIAEEAGKLVRKSRGSSSHPGGLWATAIYGGKNKHEQLQKARIGTHIMAATPGRLVDHLSSTEVSLDRVTYFVLDEADRMLEEGFHCQLKTISDMVRPDRHMMFFSATWPPAVDNLAREMCKGNGKPVHLGVGQREDGRATTREEIVQEVVVFTQDTWDERDRAKKALLYSHIREVLQDDWTKILVFVNSKALADELKHTLWKEGFSTDAMHGGRSQDQRLAVLDAFKRGETRLLVTTDVMGRGLDIPSVSHVVIYDMGEVEDYVHRIGRTARGPHGQGHALTFYEYDRKWPQIPGGLVQVLEESGQEVPDELRELAELAENGEYPRYGKKYGAGSGGGGEGPFGKKNGASRDSRDSLDPDDVYNAMFGPGGLFAGLL